MEGLFRDALLAVGLQLFGPLLQQRVDRIDAEFKPKPGQHRVGRRPLEVDTLFGTARVERDYYTGVGGGHSPADAALALEGSTTPALARLVCRAAAQQPYGAASQDLAAYGAIVIDERQIQRLVRRIGPAVDPWMKGLAPSAEPLPILYVSCDGTGTPMRAEELAGRKGKQADGSSKTREVKLGAVFTQHRTDEKGRAVRDHESTTYVGSYETAIDFSLRLREESRRRGLGNARQVVFISDGARWAEDIGKDCFAGAASILDFYHAGERLHALSESLGGANPGARAALWKDLLLRDRVAEVIAQAETLRTQGVASPEGVEEHLGFIRRHRERMLYGTYRGNGWFIGSGVVEAGCRTVVGKRLKQSGMFWSESGATCVLNFRTLLLSRRLDAFWVDRANAAAARNDSLALAA